MFSVYQFGWSEIFGRRGAVVVVVFAAAVAVARSRRVDDDDDDLWDVADVACCGLRGFKGGGCIVSW